MIARTVLMDPVGNVIDLAMIPIGTMLPVEHFVTKSTSGEIVLVARIDPQRTPESVWNLSVLG